MKLNLISFDASDYYKTGSLVVEHDGRQFEIKAFDGVRQAYADNNRYECLDKHILTEAESEFNHYLHSLTFFMEWETLNWSEKKQLTWIGECDIDDDDEPIENDDGFWVNETELNDHLMELIQDGINCSDEIENHIKSILEDEAEAAEAAAEFESKFSTTPIIQQQGIITEIYDRCEMKDGEEDYALIIGERCGRWIERVLVINGRLALVECDNLYWNVYVDDEDGADANSMGKKDWKEALEEFNELVSEEEVA